MKKKAKIAFKFLKKKFSLAREFIRRNLTTILGLVMIVMLAKWTTFFHRNDGTSDSTLIGVCVALVVGIGQINTANKNSSNNIQIRKAEFTIKFIKDFQKSMHELDFCAHLYKDFNISDEKVKLLYDKLMERDNFNFSMIEYKNLKRDLGINDDDISNAKNNYREDTDHVIEMIEKHYNEYGYSEFSSFHEKYDIYIQNLSDFNNKENMKFKSFKDEDELRRFYVSSIFQNIQTVVNDLECNSLSVQFDLLDYNKITNLVYTPLHYYVSSLYITMMENMINRAEKNYVIYSNIKKFCSEVINIKKHFDDAIERENIDSERRKENLMSIEVKNLEQ